MKPNDKNEPALNLKYKNSLDRVDSCIRFLSIHGFLSGAERQKAVDRMNKWLWKDKKAGEEAVKELEQP